METYVQKYDNVISDELCDKLVKRFEENPKQQEKLSQGSMSMTHLDLFRPENSDVWKNDVLEIVEIFKKCIEKYQIDCNIDKTIMWPQKYLFESFWIKRYLPDGVDQFGPHVDARDVESCKRFLVFFLYLDNNDAGSTTFPQLDIASDCKKGSLLMFPPMWPWLHTGEKPVDKPKYILGSYLKYV